MSIPEIAFILPQYGQFRYSHRAALSFFKHTPGGHCIVVDDCSPAADPQAWAAWGKDMPPGQMTFKRNCCNRGLTYGWNLGLREARRLGAEYTICGNSDILFTPGWQEGLCYNLQNGYDLVGPLTNTPGLSGLDKKGQQAVARYCPGYEPYDDSEYLAKVADYLSCNFKLSTVVSDEINGFFLLAKTDTWWGGSFDDAHVFDPSKRMVGGEGELQRRWVKMGRLTGFVPSSFIFHYRSVSRGDKYKRGLWARLVGKKSI